MSLLVNKQTGMRLLERMRPSNHTGGKFEMRKEAGKYPEDSYERYRNDMKMSGNVMRY